MHFRCIDPGSRKEIQKCVDSSRVEKTECDINVKEHFKSRNNSFKKWKIGFHYYL